MSNDRRVKLLYPLAFIALQWSIVPSWSEAPHRVRIISEAHCMFGDADLLVRDIISRAARSNEARVVLEIQVADTKKEVLKKELVDLSTSTMYAKFDPGAPDVQRELLKVGPSDTSIKSFFRLLKGLGREDSLSAITIGNGLLVEVPNLLPGEYTLEICSILPHTTSCSSLNAQRFDEMFDAHVVGKAPRPIPAERLYFASRFRIGSEGSLSPGASNERTSTIDNIALKSKDGDLIVNVPHFDQEKCAALK